MVDVSDTTEDATGTSEKLTAVTLAASVIARLQASDISALGYVIGTDVQAYDADLDDLADGSLTGSKVGAGISGTNVTTGTVDKARIDPDIARDTEVAAAFLRPPQEETGATVVPSVGDELVSIELAAEGAQAFDVPSNATAGFAIGTRLEVVRTSTVGDKTFGIGAGAALDGSCVLTSPNSGAVVSKTSTNGWRVLACNVISQADLDAKQDASTAATDAELTSGLAAQDECSEITGCVENALVSADQALTFSSATAATYTLLDTDEKAVRALSDASAVAVTVPASLAAYDAGFCTTFVQSGAGTLTVDFAAVTHTDGPTATTAQGDAITVCKTAADIYVSF